MGGFSLRVDSPKVDLSLCYCVLTIVRPVEHSLNPKPLHPLTPEPFQPLSPKPEPLKPYRSLQRTLHP